jgi:hypothetical protein
MGNTSTILLLISIIFFSSTSNAGLIYGISNSGYFIGYDTTTGNSLPASFRTAFSRDDTLIYDDGSLYGISNSGYFIGYDTTTGNSLPASFRTAFSRDDTLMHIPIAVQEPSTLAIFVLGMIGLISRQFKKQS